MAWLQEHALPLLLLVAVLAFLFRGPVMARLAGVESITVHALSERMASTSAPLLLDVRTPAEFKSGHIPDAVPVPLSELSERIDALRARAVSRDVALICLSGSRSTFGAVTLKRAGFEKVFNVIGGMANWKAQGYPVR